MRRTLATLLLAGSLAAPASAAPARNDVVLTGARSASLELTFATRFRPDVGIFGGRHGVAVSTRGTYAGAVFQSLAKPNLAIGVVVVPAMAGYGGNDPVAWGGSDRGDFSLPAGRYRVHLLADGPSTVRVAVDGLAREVRATPRTPSRVVGRVVEVDAVRAEIPVTVRPATTTVLVASADADAGVGGAMSACLDEGAQAPCEAGTGPGFKATFLAPSVRSTSRVAIFVYPGWVRSGEHTARYAIAQAGVVRGLYAFALSVDR